MKRILQFTKEDDLKFETVVRYLFDSRVEFTAHYKVDGDSTIEFECDDRFYDCMLEEVPRIYRDLTK
jgi:hypothetical protein